jgi:hypothetical protein
MNFIKKLGIKISLGIFAIKGGYGGIRGLIIFYFFCLVFLISFILFF